jgi:hypothetical protein
MIEESKPMTKDELVQACHEHVQAQRAAEEAAKEPEWTGHLHITPDIVAEILDSNKEE